MTVQVNIRRGAGSINLNASPWSLGQLPFVRTIAQMRPNETFERVTETYTLRLDVSGDLSPDFALENSLLELSYFLNAITDANKSYTYPVLLEVIPSSGTPSIDTFGFAARLFSYNITLPDTDLQYVNLRGITDIQLELERGPFYNRRMYGMRTPEGGSYQVAENSTVFRRVPGLLTSSVGNTVGSTYNQRALLQNMVYVSGILDYETPFYIITSNHPALAVYDVIAPGGSTLSVPSASGGSVARIAATSAVSSSFSTSNAPYYAAETSEITLFGATRVIGDIRVRARLEGTNIGQNTPYSEWVYLKEFTTGGNNVPVFNYMGTITLDPFFFSTSSSNSFFLRVEAQAVTGLSGVLLLDTVAIVPTDKNAETSIIKILPGSSVSDVYGNTHLCIFNPALGAYNDTGLGWNTNKPTFLRTFLAGITNSPNAVYRQIGQGTRVPQDFNRAVIGDIAAYYKVHTRFGDPSVTDQNVRCIVLGTAPTTSGYVLTQTQAAFRPVVVNEYPYLRGITEQST